MISTELTTVAVFAKEYSASDGALKLRPQSVGKEAKLIFSTVMELEKKIFTSRITFGGEKWKMELSKNSIAKDGWWLCKKNLGAQPFF
jgi:hypothetical protein